MRYIYFVDPEILTPPILQRKEGESAEFECLSLDYPVWFFKRDSACPQNAEISNNVLTIPKVNRCHNGNLYCMSTTPLLVGKGILWVLGNKV